jgi:CheY-like chemotaxis protein
MEGRRILVVDDEPIVGQAIKMTLQPDGYIIDVVTSPYEGLSRFEIGKYDVILTDFRMPGLTGAQFAERIKTRCPSQPIILVSGSPPFPPTLAVDLVILKPFDNLELRNAVGQFAGRRLPCALGGSEDQLAPKV